MKSHALLAILCCFPGAVWSQNLRVRIYAAHPPSAIIITAAGGSLEWRTCDTCSGKQDRTLSVDALESGLRFGARQISKNLYVSGSYHLRRVDGPELSAAFPLHIESRSHFLLITASMPLEAYVQGVLAAESGVFEQAESLKAMAVAARSYAERFRGQHASEGFDFCDTTHCQAVRWNAVNARVISAVDATRGEILLSRGTPAEAFYNQNCGGSAASADEVWPAVREPYLTGHPDPYCSIANDLKWQSRISVADLDRALREAGISTPHQWKTMEVVSRTASGRARRLRLDGGEPPGGVVSGSSLRFAVGRMLGWEKIRSDLYELRNSDSHVVFSGRGSGHGIGLCQAGAEEMAREGKSYAEILTFYYPGTRLNLGQVEEWRKQSSEDVELISTNPQQDSIALPLAERILEEAEKSIGWRLPVRVRLQIYPTLDAFRGQTGKPGWVAASTSGHTIRLQPLLELQRRSILESTLRHELFHLLVGSHARVGTPFWFQEGIVLWLSNPQESAPSASGVTAERIEHILRHSNDREEMQLAYSAAHSRVAALVSGYGKPSVLGWLGAGIPPNLSASSHGSSADSTQQ